MSDMVNHPSHYTDGNIEVIDFIEDKKLNYHRGNAVKYICRAGKKDPEKEVEDLQKAVWYINREIQRLTAQKEIRKAEIEAANSGITFRDELMSSVVRHPRSWAKVIGREDLAEQFPADTGLSQAEAAEIAKEIMAVPRREVRVPEGVQS